MAHLMQIVVDREHPATVARFWAAALDGFEVRAYDDAEIDRLAGLGLTPETDPVVLVDGPHVELCFQKVPIGPRTKNRIHLDVVTVDLDREVERLVALGATPKHTFADHVWMHDPEGNDFCVASRTT